MGNVLGDIEKKYNVKSIETDGVQIWPWLRLEFMYISLKEYKSKVINRQIKISTLFELFINFLCWFRKYDYIMFSSSNQRVEVDSNMYDKSLDYIVDVLGQDKCLTIEVPYPNHFKRKKYYTQNVVSFRVLDVFRLIFKKALRTKVNIENINELNLLLKENDLLLRSKLSTLTKYFNNDVKIYTLLLKLYKPKSVFVNNAYGKMAFVFAANKLGIKTVEVQHGVIGHQHPAYNSNISLDARFYPKFILLNGTNDANAINKSKIYANTQTYIVGSYFLDEAISNFNKNSKFVKRLNDYEIRIGVTLQLDFEIELIDLIIEVARETPKFVFILIPRGDYITDLDTLDLPSNIITDMMDGFYNVIQHCDIHTTIYSTCALESPSFNITNIIYNYKNLSVDYFIGLLDFDLHKFINNKDEYISALQDFRNNKSLELDNSRNYLPGYKNNINTIISNII